MAETQYIFPPYTLSHYRIDPVIKDADRMIQFLKDQGGDYTQKELCQLLNISKNRFKLVRILLSRQGKIETVLGRKTKYTLGHKYKDCSNG